MTAGSTVLVTGVGGPAGRAGAKYFEANGRRVIGVDAREVPSPAGIFRLVPLASDPGFPDALLRVAIAEGASLVVPTVTEELPVVARMRAAFRQAGIGLCVSGPLGVDIANDKWRTTQELRRHGVAVPATLPDASSNDTVVRAFGYPFISKPRFGRGGRGVLVHRHDDDFARACPEERVWQEFLGGEEFDLNLFVERDGRVSSAVVLRKTILKGGVVGNALGVERVSRVDVVALGARAVRALGLEGPIDIDIRLGHDEAPAVLDVNARLGANVLSAPEVLDALEDAWRNGRCA